ncbi:LppX_LprAFG lipoprotein [Umezawaea beigongshangensis]|uniref:LppX_LprAFG lipoprotein n=1 Tax=Umezawaea beigongshangensis TaxID=2780383 RepID=UPI0018F228D1|nr:LppX_LprAFG lipoprotein [Umezawaea beigongshangensis]
MSARRALLGPLFVVVALVSACSSGSSGGASSDLPAAADLLSRSAGAMRSVTSTHFTVSVEGQLPDIAVRSAEGDLNGDGDARGRATTDQFGQLLEVDFVLAAKDLYVKGATGGFTKLPGALADRVYDPSAILDPDRGVAKVLSSVRDARTERSENGAHVVSGTVPRDVAAGLVPGIGSDVRGSFTISSDSSQLGSARFELDGADGKPASVEVALSGFNAPVSVTPPA